MLTALDDMIRRGDLVTNRSNVFAVWMTIGYFEATPSTDAVKHPMGYELGTERGLNDGTVTRHRKFFLIDRSIPVGFRRGVTYNHRDGTPHYQSVIVHERVLD